MREIYLKKMSYIGKAMSLQKEQTFIDLSHKQLGQGYLFVGANVKELEEAARQTIFNLYQDMNVGQNQLQKVSDQTHPDVRFFYPSSKTGQFTIEQVKEICNASHLYPNEAPKQFYVLSTAERMQDSAANALLKNLEEPTDCTTFIFLVENEDLIKPTIASRLQKYYVETSREAVCDKPHMQALNEFLQSWPNVNYNHLVSCCERVQKSLDDALKKATDEGGENFFMDREVFELFIQVEKWYQNKLKESSKGFISSKMFSRRLDKAQLAAQRSVKASICLEYLLLTFLTQSN